MINSINSTEECFKLGDFQNSILAWADYIGLIKEGCKDKQVDKIQEELNEYKEALKSGNLHDAGCEIVDVLVTCIISAEQQGIKLTDYMPIVFDKLQSRQDSGKIINGSFIKAEDLINHE